MFSFEPKYPLVRVLRNIKKPESLPVILEGKLTIKK